MQIVIVPCKKFICDAVVRWVSERWKTKRPVYLLEVSGDVTTGGSVYLNGPDADASSPTGGKNVLFAGADAVGTALALSALLLINAGANGGEPPPVLLLRRRASMGDTGCDCAIVI